MVNFNFNLTFIELYFIFATTATFLLYIFDKIQAIRIIKNISRIPESIYYL